MEHQSLRQRGLDGEVQVRELTSAIVDRRGLSLRDPYLGLRSDVPKSRVKRARVAA